MLILVMLLFLIASPSAADACDRSEFLGRVKAVSEYYQDRELVPTKMEWPGEHLLERSTTSQDGATVESLLYQDVSPYDVFATVTANYENGRLVKSVQKRGGEVYSTVTCLYDAQGRVIEDNDDSKGEFSILQRFEYSPGTVRVRTRVNGSWSSVTTQTLDESGRVVKEVTVSEVPGLGDTTSEYFYEGMRTQTCLVGPRTFGRRECVTTTIVKDSHGNETLFESDYEKRTTSYEYDEAGNWTLKRVLLWWSTAGGHSIEQIIRRKIEYW